MSFVNRPPQLKVRQRVEILLGGLLSFWKTEDSGTDFLDFRKVFVILLEPSCLESSLRRSGQGCGLSVISFQLLSYLGGSGTIFGAACRGLAAVFPESTGDLDFEISRRWFLLWSKLIGLVDWSFRCLGQTSLVQTSPVQTSLVRVHRPLADLRWMEPCSHQWRERP